MVALGAGARPYSPRARPALADLRAAPVTRVEEARGLLPGAPSPSTRDRRRDSPYDSPIGAPGTHAGENRFLYAIISTVGSSLDLEEVLGAVVRLLTDASSVHACFVYLVEETTRLVLEAASEPYAHLVGEIALERGEGLAWWAAEHKEPAWIRDELLDDPRVKYVPELEEERFQSLVSVPIVGKDGNVIGVISSHTEAPREFTEDEVDVLVSSASLVAGAIENARLYEEMRRRVDELEHLTELGELARRGEDPRHRAPGCRRRARGSSSAPRPATSTCSTRHPRCCTCAPRRPRRADARAAIGLSELGPELARSGRSASVAVPLVANDELLGLLAATGPSEVDLARAVANQTAVALKKIELIERLTEKNLIKDFFEQLARGAVARPASRAGRRGSAATSTSATSSSPPRLPRTSSSAASPPPRPAPSSTAATTRCARSCASRTTARNGCSRAVRALQEELEAPVSIGLSNVCRGAASFAAGFEEARHALLGTTVLQGDARRHGLRGARAVQVPPAHAVRRRASGTRTATRSRASPSTTASARPRSCARSRSSCAAAAPSARPPRRSTSTRTRCASACAASASSPASTCARTTGSWSRSP